MWVELIFGLVVIYRVVRRFFYDDEDHVDFGSSGSNALFAVAERLQALYGGKAYVGLRIPDPDTASRQNIDLVLVTKKEAVVVSVINASGIASIDGDGTWVCTDGSKHKTERLQDPMVEAKRQAAVLESYLEQRGVALPDGYLSCKIVCPNPNFRTIHPDYFPPEVVTYEQWTELKPERKSISGWIKGALHGDKKEMQESVQNLGFILSTAPMWDRLELKNNIQLLGEFLEFKGKQDDILSLRNIKRSKVSRLTIQKTSMFAHSKLQLLYAPRDYRSEGGSGLDWNEVTVRSSTEVLFQLQDPAKVQKIKLSSIINMSLSP
ncbi:NERD-like protein [Cynara cardunculus var. scolymus]|uniref:NERD-like protein n=1 Tax=Cynara cardunculus var. scolymus TaxID=59895 RepID=A0A103Y942_CYNCS|nr:NERD-like protein [Cynara cardunculus var. scolymus]